MTETHLKHLGFASVAAVNQYLRFAQDHGLNTDAALSSAGLTDADLAEGSKHITGEQFQAILRSLIEESGVPLLGLNSGDYVQPGSYNVLGYIVMSCANLGEAIARIAPFEKLVGDMGTTTIHPVAQHPDQLEIRWHCAYPDPVVRPHMVDNVFASWVNFSRWLANDPTPAPEQVLLQRLAPDMSEYPADSKNPAFSEKTVHDRYQEVFDCPVLFGQSRDAIIFSKSLLEFPLRQPDQLLRKTLEGHASELLKSLFIPDQSDFTEQVRNELRRQLHEGITRQDMVAEALEVTPRTLQRRLSEKGFTYQQLLDQVRLESTRKLLRETDMSIAGIAEQLGFAEPRSFHRWFKSCTGQTPGEFRDATQFD